MIEFRLAWIADRNERIFDQADAVESYVSQSEALQGKSFVVALIAICLGPPLALYGRPADYPAAK